MNFRKFFSINDALDMSGTGMNESDKNEEKRIKGKIIYLDTDKGWGFITSAEIPFTRIFFHWTALYPDTLNFTELEKHMKVEFVHKIFEENKHRAIKIKVLPDESTSTVAKDKEK